MGSEKVVFLVIFIHPFENSGGYFFRGRLFWWILDINLQNFVRGYFSKFSLRALLDSNVHPPHFGKFQGASWRRRKQAWPLSDWGALLQQVEYAFTKELSLFVTMGRAEVRGRKRRRIQEEEELVTSSIVQVAIIVLPPLVVFHTKFDLI